MQQANDIPYDKEIERKAIHLSSIAIPIAYYYLPRALTLEILVPVAVLSLALDIGRYYNPAIARWFYATFKHLLRPHELDTKRKLLSGATYVFVSAVICVSIFPKLITVAAFSVLIVSDTAAALIGRRYGKTKFFQKSREGAIAFFISALLVIAVIPKLQSDIAVYIATAISAFVATIVEAASIVLRVDDNLAVPLSMGCTMWALMYFLSAIFPERYEVLYTAIVGWK